MHKIQDGGHPRGEAEKWGQGRAVTFNNFLSQMHHRAKQIETLIQSLHCFAAIKVKVLL